MARALLIRAAVDAFERFRSNDDANWCGLRQRKLGPEAASTVVTTTPVDPLESSLGAAASPGPSVLDRRPPLSARPLDAPGHPLIAPCAQRAWTAAAS